MAHPFVRFGAVGVWLRRQAQNENSPAVHCRVGCITCAQSPVGTTDVERCFNIAKAHHPNTYASSHSIPFFFKNARNSSSKENFLWCSAWALM